MEASLAATGMLEVLATRAVLFMMLSGFPSTSMVSYSDTKKNNPVNHWTNNTALFTSLIITEKICSNFLNSFYVGEV